MSKPQGSTQHAILVTWQDMKTKTLTEFLARAQKKYGDKFKQVEFVSDNNAVKTSLEQLVKDVPTAPTHYLKIFIGGHGGAGSFDISSDNGNDTKTVDELADVLAYALKGRAATWEDDPKTEVVMVSCLFGRGVDGELRQSPAAELHRALITAGVYVRLVAWTLSLTSDKNKGNKIFTRLHKLCVKPEREWTFMEKHDYQFDHMFGKMAYTKVHFTCNGRVSVGCLRGYKEGDNLEEDSLEARQLLWADWVIDRILDALKEKVYADQYVNPKATYLVEWAPHVTLMTIGEQYETDRRRRPSDLKEALERNLSRIKVEEKKESPAYEASSYLDRAKLAVAGTYDPAQPSILVGNWLKRFPQT